MRQAMESGRADSFGPHPALIRRPIQARELCQLVTDWTGRVAAGGQIVEPKLDGIRALWINGELVTREGTPIAGAEHIEAELLRLEHEAALPIFFDAEFQVGGTFAATLAHFAAGGRGGDDGMLWIFDAMPLAVWRGEDPSETLEARRGKLDRLLKGSRSPAVRAMPWAYMTDPAEIERHARDFIAQGAEGIVTKHALGTYRRGRTNGWQRIKRAITLDLEITGYEAERARPHMLGCLIVDHAGVPVRVHAGFSEAERMALWRDRADLVGAMAEIESMEKTDAGSLRSPRFVRMRYDKGKR